MPCCAVPAGDIRVIEVILLGARPVNVRLLLALQKRSHLLVLPGQVPTAGTHYNVIHIVLLFNSYP